MPIPSKIPLVRSGRNKGKALYFNLNNMTQQRTIQVLKHVHSPLLYATKDV
jgi:hypothetical protein